MNKFFKILTATIILSVFMPLTSCDVMYESMMNPYGGYGYGYYSPYYGGGGDNSYLLDPNYAMWQAQQQTAQQQQFMYNMMEQSSKQAEDNLKAEYLRDTNGGTTMTYEEWSKWKYETTPGANTNNNTSNTPSSTSNKCPRCNGTGRIVYDTNPPMFGQSDYKVKCNECGEYHLKSTGHTHITCPLCHGKGHN